MHNNFYAVIMAGGTGTRLWPVSRKEKPKQFQKFTSSKTMIQETFERVAKVVLKENIFVSTTADYKSLVLEQLPEISDKQLLIEPSARGTAAAIALVAKSIYKLNPEAIVATVASDHAIKNVDEFVTVITVALEAAEKNKDKLVTVGINPTYPDTGMGYLKMGKEFSNGQRRIFYVDSFQEKPDQETAEKYLAGWEYLWNASYFIFSAEKFLEWTRKYTPKIINVLNIVDEKERLEKYNLLDNVPIDTALVEKMDSENRLVVPSELLWSDVGNWGSLFDFFKDSLKSEMIVKGNHIDSGSKNCLVYSEDKLVATIGLKDIIIVETNDAILVANKNQVSEVKHIIEKLRKEGKHLYL
jgi:mannose-1-phosphate guanylyltransferase